jgi:hypothetical protein
MLASTAFAADADLVARAFDPAPPAFVPQGGGGGSSSGLPRLGVGVKVSMLLGIGVEAATSVTRKSNVRGGFNMFRYDYDYDKDNITYGAKMRLRSAQATFDWFPFGGGFHLSPGALMYNGNKIDADVSVGGGKTFTLGSTTYTSKSSDPVHGTGILALNEYKVAPMILFGWGNLLKRSNGRFSVNFELCADFTGTPKATLNLTGSACPGNQQVVCQNAATDPTVQSNVQSEQKKFNDAIEFLRATPVISLTLGYKIF